MMGSWKSTIGLNLSKLLNYSFVDTDEAIEKSFGEKISEIFKYKGESKFRELESKLFIQQAKKKGNVISTGGGIILCKKNRITLRENGITIFLKAKPETLSFRVKNITKRPLLKGYDTLHRLSEIWNIRRKFYEEVADLTIETDRLSPIQVQNIIIKKLQSYYEIN